MSRRVTRSTKQGQISDHFSHTRNGSELPGKSLKDEAPSSTGSAKRSLFSSGVQVQLNEWEDETVSVQKNKCEEKSRPARALFFAPNKIDKVKKEIKVESAKDGEKEEVVEPVRSMIPTDADIVESKPIVNRKQTVADVQAELAKKGAAKVHEQTTARKLEQIAEREAFLKSPQKMIQTRISGGSPPKRAKKETKKREGPVRVLRVPDHVLPSKSIEKAKERPVRERSEDREVSPQEDSIARAPAGYGSSLLNDEVKKSANVSLPTSYQELLQLFKACDQMYSLLDSHGKTITFSMLAKAVRSDTKKEFSLDRFAQLLAVYPQAYTVQVKHVTCVGDRMGGLRSGRWEHVIKVNVGEDLSSFVTGPLPSEQPLPSEPILTSSPCKNRFSPMKGRPIISSSGMRVPASPRKPASPVKKVQREVMMDTRKKLEGWRVACRYQVFRCLLSRRVISAHDEFMNGLELDTPVVPLSSLLPTVFHKEFLLKINSLCPSIQKAEIDQIPEEENVAGNSHQGMGDFIKIISDTVAVLPKAVDECLLELKSPVKKSVSARGVPLSPAKFREAPKQMSLLERIKAKNAALAAAELRRNPELEAKLSDLVRLLDDRNLALIFDIYRTSSRTSIDISILAERMAGTKRITKDKVPSLLTRLTSLVPTHFSIGTTSIGKFIRVSPDNSPTTFTTVESLLKKERAVCQTQSAAGGSLRSP